MTSLTRITLSALLAMGVLTGARYAAAGPTDAVLWPTATPTPTRDEHRNPEDAEKLTHLARQVDAILSEAVQDLGLTLTLSERGHDDDEPPSDDAMVERAKDSWVISPRIRFEAGDLRLELVAVAPGHNVLLTRTQRVTRNRLEVRASVMMRDLIQSEHPRAPEPPPSGAPPLHEAQAPRSQGRAVLSLNSAVFGGYVGFALQNASGSNDARLVYPLVALGTGIGLGASMLVTEEWDIGLGDAWYLSAGTWWPIVSELSLARSYGVRTGNAYMGGVAAAAGGLTLGAAALTLHPISEGGAVIAHTGGAFGTLFGGLTELAYRGTTKITPERGIGYGAGAGVLLGGVIGMRANISGSRMLLIDLGASLGALTGAAAASPLLLVEEKESKVRDRLWLSSIALGALAGGAIGIWSTNGSPNDSAWTRLHAQPYFAVLPAEPLRGTAASLNAGFQGLW
ncbi:MAG TPA: hypothetical protein VGM29_11125 [Polyangiaceae bacterium]